MRTIAFWIFAALILVIANGLILQKERLKASGTTVFLKLAPADPRALMKGDYMTLNYDAANQIRSLPIVGPRKDGRAVIKLDEKKIGEFVRIHQGEELATDEILMPFSFHDWQVKLGPGEFYFQEGQAKLFQPAQYGELRVSPSGECVLVGLRGKNLEPLGPPGR